MSVIVCRNCGGTTNTAMADWIHSRDGKADRCYLKFENNLWVKGCAYDQADPVFTKPFIDEYLRDQPQNKPMRFPSIDEEEKKS